METADAKAQHAKAQQVRITIPVTGMSCAPCVRRVEHALANHEGVAEANVNFASEKASVAFHPEATKPDELIRAIRDAGCGYGHDLVVGGNGEDTLDGGPGSDEINARDGQKNTVVIRLGEYDTVYYDEGLDVLREQSVSQEGTDVSAELTASGTGKTELVAKRPPVGLFAHTGKVLVEHGGKELLIPEGELEGHLGHGDEIIDPTGRAAA
jgi:copper chaperone CopZ